MALDLKQPIIINWGVTEAHGWGLVGLHTSLYLIENGHVPILLLEPRLTTLQPQNLERMQPCVILSEKVRALVAQQTTPRVRMSGYTALLALGRDMTPSLEDTIVTGDRNIGVLPGEGAVLDAAAVERGNGYDRIISHSTYMVQLLKQVGVRDARLALQGVDPTDLHPGPRTGRFGDRFVVFSGGKLEYRKGQDIVLQAFRIFHQRHPDALLVTLWNNLWPQLAMDMAESTLAPSPPVITGEAIDLERWSLENGLVPGSFLNIPFLPRAQLAPLMWECDLAVFPNRCEAGTNLVAMEAMACGLPVVLSVNTGHLDLVAPGRCYMLADQKPVPNTNGGRMFWGESSVEELVARMEEAYQDRDEAKRRGAAGSDFILTHRTWRKFAENFIAAVEE